MKFTIPKSTFATALARCAAIVERKSSMPILCCVLFEPLEEALKISVTDLEIGYITTIDGIGWEDYAAEGLLYSIAVPAKKLLECVKAIPVDEIEITIVRSATITISGGTTSFTLGLQNAEEYPALPLIEGEQFEISASALTVTLGTVTYAQSKSSTKPHLCASLLKIAIIDDECDELDLITVATDGHRLAVAEYSFEGKAAIVPEALIKGIIISAKGTAEICKIKTPGIVLFSLSGSSLCISTDNETIFLRLIDATYPDYTRIIPELCPVKIKSPRQPLIDALERCRIITDKDSKGILITTDATGIIISSDLPSICGSASDTVTAIVPELPFTTRINVDYLLEALEHTAGATCDIEGKDENTPLVIQISGTESVMHIIMPMRLN